MKSRSLLFIPADKERMLQKVNKLSADIILIDLEDAVAPGDKQTGRNLIKENLPLWNKPVFIRVNSIETSDFKKDMDFIVELNWTSSLQGVMLPKAASKQDIELVANYLLKTEETNQIEAPRSIIPLIETAWGVKNAYEIASESSRVCSLAFGGVDFTNDIRAEVTISETELLYARSEIVIASRCANIEQPIDTVFTDFNNNEGLRDSCSFAKSLGFGGKLLIHPKQINIANQSFSPTKEEVEFAKKVVLQSNNRDGAFQLEGKMIDKPIIERAQILLRNYESELNSNI